MPLSLDRSSGTPISRQLADQLRAEVLGGRLRPGDRLASVRDLATELAINPNTVLRVYEKLTAEGLVERKHGWGTFVAERPDAGALSELREQLAADAGALARRGRSLGFTPDQLAAFVRDAAERGGTDHGKRHVP